MRLSGKRVLITGAASGIGEATARRFAAEGAAVMLADLNLDAAQAVADDIATGGAAIARAVAVDVTDDAQVALMIKVAIDALGAVDIIVNNAGIPMVGPVETLSGEDWDLELDVNLKSIYRTSKAIWPHFRAQGGGVILNTASVAGLVGMAGQHSYSVAKAGVVMLTKCMALDGAPDRIRVNCICPGFVETPMATSYIEAQTDPAEARRQVEGLHPMGRIGAPDDIANGFLFLASDEAAWITGIALPVDGGWAAGAA